jgi:hypothetical protein
VHENAWCLLGLTLAVVVGPGRATRSERGKEGEAASREEK